MRSSLSLTFWIVVFYLVLVGGSQIIQTLFEDFLQNSSTAVWLLWYPGDWCSF